MLKKQETRPDPRPSSFFVSLFICTTLSLKANVAHKLTGKAWFKCDKMSETNSHLNHAFPGQP